MNFRTLLYSAGVTLLLTGCAGQLAFTKIESALIEKEPIKRVYASEKTLKAIQAFADNLKHAENKHLSAADIANGLQALAGKDYIQANTHFQHALKFAPRSAHLHKLNALSYHLRGDGGDPEQYKLAEIGYRLAITMDPGDSMTPYYLGILYFSQSKMRQAQEYFAQAILLDSSNSDYYLGLAAASYYLGELGNAYANIQKATSLAPNSPATLQAGGLIYASLGAFERASSNNDLLAKQSRARQRYLGQRINEWKNYYTSQAIKSDQDIQYLMAQNLDVFGVPEGGMFDPTDSDNRVPMSSTDSTDISADDPVDSQASSSPIITSGTEPAIDISGDDPVDSQASSSPIINTPTKHASGTEPAIKIPQMALVDVVIIRTEETYKSSKGLNLLNGLNLFFTADSFYTGKSPFGIGSINTPITTNDTYTIQLGTNGAGLNYSLNIFSDNYIRNEVIARPTILVQDRKTSSFFSGGTMHIVIEGGVAGSGYMEPINTGIKLEVTPNFLNEDTVGIEVSAERTFLEAGLSEVSSTITGTTFAVTTKTTISANLTLRYGETMVLSGLLDQEKEIIDDRVPLLGEIPLIQYLFREQTKESGKKTILVLLTPRRANLSLENGDLIEEKASVQTKSMNKLKKTASWMRPASHLSAFVHHLSKYEYFNHYRKGDIQLESWSGEGTVDDTIMRTLEYLYIFYNFEKNSKSDF